MIRVRKSRLFPRQISDAGAFIFVVIMIPLTYIYESTIVVPALYNERPLMYIVHNLIGAFILINLIGNFCGLWLVDTSTRHLILPSTIKKYWNFCTACESAAPPRAFHCNVCNVCILKREHHCMFAGYCVGHRNHRYFILFLAYMFIGVSYCTFFNSVFVYPQINETLTWNQTLKFIFPLIMLVTGIDFSWLQLYIFFWSVHVAALLLTGVLLLYHLHLIINGRTTYENNRRLKTYDLGSTQNILEVMGNNWKVALICPFVDSKLPHNGIEWDTLKSWKLEGQKNR